MGQSLGITTGENKWRSNTEYQKQRNTLLPILKKSEKIEFIKWAKDFDSEPFSYMNFCKGQYILPENTILSIMAMGYISDISELKRLHNEENIRVDWSPIPFGITKEEWDNPESVKDTLIDRSDAENDSNEDSDLELGKNINQFEEVVDKSDSEGDSDSE